MGILSTLFPARCNTCGNELKFCRGHESIPHGNTRDMKKQGKKDRK